MVTSPRIWSALLGLQFLLSWQTLTAQSLVGTVRDSNGDGIATASVYLEGTTIGTLTDAAGNYKLDLEPGTYRIAVKMLGYMKQVKTVLIPTKQPLNFVLPDEEIEIEETIITSNGKDPAYWIIRQAIDHRPQNRLHFENYQFSSYQKTLIRNQMKMLREFTQKDAFRALKVADSLQAVQEQKGKGSVQLPADFKPKVQNQQPDTTASKGYTVQLPLSGDTSSGAMAAMLPLFLKMMQQDPSLGSLKGLRMDTLPGMNLDSLGKNIAPFLRNGLIDSLSQQLKAYSGKLPAVLQQLNPTDSSRLSQLMAMMPLLMPAMKTADSLATNPEKASHPTEQSSPNAPPIQVGSGLDPSIMYLEESLTKSSFGKGNRNKEELISGKTIGSDGKGALMGLVARMIFDFDPYNNMTYFDSIIPQGIVSPISSSALLYYNYKLLGTKKEQGHKQYKIQVIPKNPNGPTFQGLIYIADSSFAVSSLDLFLTKANDISLFDTIRVAKEYISLAQQGAWVPFGLQARLVMSLGLPDLVDLRLIGESQQLKSDWVIDPELPKGFWNQEVLHVADSAGSYSEEYWAETRKFDLQKDEKKLFERSDSLLRVHRDPAWQDSMTRVERRFSVRRFIFNGYHPKNYRHDRQFDLDAPWKSIGFNPIEGLHAQLHAKESWMRGGYERCAIDGVVRYGFANHWLSYQLGFSATLSPKRNGTLAIKGGDMPQEFSQFPQTYYLQEDFYNLFLKRNYYKAYQKQFARLSYETELVNGLKAQVAADWEWRFAWTNHSNFSIVNPNAEFSPNILIPSHQAARLTVGLSYKPFNKYWTIDGRKISMGSKWPLLSATYQKGISGLLGSDVDFDRIQGSILQSIKFGTAGTLDLFLEGGSFLNQKQVFFPDNFHFLSNQTVFHNPDLSAFQLMNYYSYSSTATYLQAHASHAFNGLLMSRLPIIKKLRMKEFAEAHYLLTPNGNWLEAGVGLQKGFFHHLLNLRVNYHLKVLGAGGSPQRLTFSVTGIGGLLGK